MDSINLDKTRNAFDFLAETPKGHAALASLKTAFDKLQSEVEPRLNRGEFLYLLRGLVDQVHVTPTQTEPAEVSGYAAVTGAVFQGQPGAVRLAGQATRFQGLNRITPSGFVIRAEV